MDTEEIIVILDKMKENIENDLPIFEDIQIYSHLREEWVQYYDDFLENLENTVNPMRIKPKQKPTIIVNGKEFIPEYEELEFNERYYIPDIGNVDGVLECTWMNIPIDYLRLKRNIIYRNYNDAFEHKKEVLKMFGMNEE